MLSPVIDFQSIIPFSGGVAQHVLISDILFLSVKAHAGKLRSSEGFLSTAGDLASLTANSGKDMYIARAQVTFFINNISASQAVGDEVVLKINGTIVETSKSTLNKGTAQEGTSTHTYEFKNIGHRVTAGQIIKLEVITLDSQTDVEGFIECFEETTNDSPFQPSEFE